MPKKKSLATIEQAATDTAATIEDKVRALPENQGINEDVMKEKVVTEITQSKEDGMFNSSFDPVI